MSSRILNMQLSILFATKKFIIVSRITEIKKSRNKPTYRNIGAFIDFGALCFSTDLE